MIDHPVVRWFKSSHSSSSQDCVEIAHFDGGQVGVRDSKNPTGPALTFTPAAWDRFLASTRRGEFTRP
ncbi:DUF397 domain-containing protein [Nocardia cyriacigeorgica]|uniref:DUF397 domain-containing protein n=1 Tax=Nocardia cyriacigeorgica TaxID=135487 RepID=UPI001895D6DE|nr:DUF397 domain-containing protein [Nocardia cyriacigeorgica]MBF6457144.1 DUF397 domain-containing protein [Nocardia cyriacigeorgica]MBF6479074.1 DUF397 domain-containing protein [Nocardia cyriacigeorgica]MBF6554195.1 DUF397 domain-containing protein [Nocardia cyriacigeorgica]